MIPWKVIKDFYKDLRKKYQIASGLKLLFSEYKFKPLTSEDVDRLENVELLDKFEGMNLSPYASRSNPLWILKIRKDAVNKSDEIKTILEITYCILSDGRCTISCRDFCSYEKFLRMS